MKVKATIFFVFVYLFAVGQTSTDQLFRKADSAYFDLKDYRTALNTYKKIKAQLKESDKDYAYTIEKIAKSLFYLEGQESDKNEWDQSIILSKEFIDLIEKEGKYVDAEVVQKKYWMYKNVIVGYFGLDKKNKAKPFQNKLYQAYKNKQLPEGMKEYYCFEKFVYDNQNIWGYEWFAQLGDKEAEGSFSKHIYYIYSRDSAGNDKNQLFTLQTVKIHKFKGEEPDFVLTKRTYLENEEDSQSIWTYTFTNPVDYKKLHDAVLEVLKGRVEPDTKSIIYKNK